MNGAHPQDSHRGLVLGTDREASTPLGFSVFVDEQSYLQLDDVVHVQTALPGGEAVDVYGVVDEVTARQEGVTLTSDVSLVQEGLLPARNVVSAHVSVTRVEPEIYVPPMPGQRVSLAAGDARGTALYFDKMRERIPLGLSRTGEPVFGNLEFLDGTRGAHVNISGISGVATKTSYATYLLYALFEGGALGDRAANSKALIFNVKGEDLLFLDLPNRVTAEDPEERERYAHLGLPVGPFERAGFFAPVRKGGQPMPDTGSRQHGVVGCFWTLREFCEKGYIQYLFADADSDRGQLGFLIDNVDGRLRRAARETPPGTSNVVVDGEPMTTFDELLDAIDAHVDPDSDLVDKWTGSGASALATGTARAFMRRLRAAARHVGHLVRGDEFEQPEAHRVDLDGPYQVLVVDLHRLHDRAQRFVVGVLLQELMERREGLGGADRPAPFFVVVDELNKYAPREGRSPIKEVLLDIAERGRSLGIILIGAQQTASEVEPRIVANASFRVVGRLDAAEAQRGEYRFLGSAMRDRSVLLKPGSMIVQQPEIPVPLLVQFPHPSWATRKQEVADTGEGAASPAAVMLDFRAGRNHDRRFED